jgi:hypothetical protein
MKNGGRTGLGRACQKTGQIKEMGSEYPKIQRAAPVVFLASGTKFQEGAEVAVLEDFFGEGKCRVISVAVRNGQRRTFCAAKSEDFIGLFQGADKRFFDVDAAGSGMEGGGDPGVVMVDVSGTDGHQFWSNGFEQDLGICKSLEAWVSRAEPGGSSG